MEGGAEEHTAVVRKAPRTLLVLAGAVAAVIVVGVVALGGSGDDGDGATAGSDSCDGRFVDGIDLLVYLVPQVTVDQTQVLRARLEADDRVDDLRYVDQEATYEEFKVLFAESPQLLRTVTPDILPPSFRLGLDDEDDTTRLVKELKGVDGVYEVLDRAGALAFRESGSPLARREC